MITLKNKNYHKVLPSDIYIGRGSALGNPFTHKPGTSARFLVSSRDEAINQYEIWLNKQLNEKNPEVVNAMNAIFKKVRVGSVSLVCYCAPHRCHGEVIRKVIEEKLNEVGLKIHMV